MSKTPFISVTIARQMGAGGLEVGRKLARRLGYAYLDRAILRMVARQVGINDKELTHWDEHVSTFWERLAQVLIFGPAEATYTAAPQTGSIRDHQLFLLESQVIREAAFSRNVVIIGRAGFHVLRDHPGLVSVYLHAPLAARINTLIRTQNITDPSEAREIVERVDADRMRFVREMTGRHPYDANCYHLSINTDRIGLTLAEDMIVSLIEHVKRQIEESTDQ
jgi:cytidylate kinase